MSIGAVAIACNAGPPPRDLSNADAIPIHNTAAQVENVKPVTEVQDSRYALDVLAEPDRTPRDRALDSPRQAADLLTYLGVAPGMRVAELGAGGGYVTELLARSVGASGRVFAVNPPSLVARAGVGDAWSARLASRANAQVVRVDRELGAPLDGDARGLDLVYLGVFYRDLASMGVDRRSLDTNVFAALRPGGRFVVIDRAPPQAPGARADLHALHTEESRNARYEIERAGFRLVNEGRFLRGSTSDRDWNESPSASPTPLETQDRFFLTFVKP